MGQSSTLLAVPSPRMPRGYGRVIVAGRSMQPTLADGDRLLVRWGGTVRAGRLVIVRLPGGVLAVKRALRRDGDGWWVERDNPAEGVDSWQIGAIPDGQVLGTVLLRYRRGPRPGAP